MKFHVIIPARYASTRLPGKPLLDIAGKPMVRHVYEQAQHSMAAHVIVATDDERIYKAVDAFGAQVVMTSVDHPSGTDRLQEVVESLGLPDDAIVVNVQGDEPMIPPELIDQVAKNLSDHPDAGVATLCERLHDLDSVLNPNVVKVVFDHQGYANYFSRAPIPWDREAFSENQKRLSSQAEYYRHIGIYAYRAGFLREYVSWSPCMTEQVECLEQLRALENGAKIHVDVARMTPPAGVDTEADLERVRAHFQRQ